MIHAKRGVGKTFVALSIGYAIATGSAMLKWSAPIPRKVLYIDGEMPATSMQERLRMLAKSFTNALPDSSYFKLITPDFQETCIRDLSSKIGQDDINDHLEGVDLVIIDNLSTLVRSGSENEAESWLPIQEWALSLRKKGKSVLFIHHAGKGGQQRGTSRKEDVLDTVIVLKQSRNYNPKDGAKFEVHFEKSRGFSGDAALPFEVHLTTSESGMVEWSCSTLKKSDTDVIIELSKEGITQREIAKTLGMSLGSVNKHLQEGR